MPPNIFDKQGQPKDWEWLIGEFGEVTYWESQEANAWRLAEIRERPGHSSFVVSLRDGDGRPVTGITVIRYWPDAPKLPEWTPPPERWFNRGVHGETNAEGNIGFGMGRGDQNFPPQPGASSAWVGELGVGSDCFNGLGWTAQDVHLDLVFQRMEGPPPPPPGPGFEELVLAYLQEITTRLGIVIDLLRERLAK